MPNTRFVGPQSVLEALRAWGISPERLLKAPQIWHTLAENLEIQSVLAAHPELVRFEDGFHRFVG
jgi:hypothetical protein